MFASFWIIYIFLKNLKYLKNSKNNNAYVEVGAKIFVVYWAASCITYFSLSKSFDWQAYERAFIQIYKGMNPYENYTDYKWYLYPPPFAQILLFIKNLIEWSMKFLGVKVNSNISIGSVYYFYTAAQIINIYAIFILLVRFARINRIGKISAYILSLSFLLLFNPMWDTFYYNQVDCFVLYCLLFALCYGTRHTMTSAMAIAIGIMIKIYPAAILAYWGVMRRWRLFILGVCMLLILFLMSFYSHNGRFLWESFVDNTLNFPKYPDLYNNSLYSFYYNTMDIFGGKKQLANILWQLTSLFIGFLFLFRLIQREFLWKKFNTRSRFPSVLVDRLQYRYRYCGHIVDAIILSLLVSPTIWPHHLVLSIPVLIWSYQCFCSEKSHWYLAIALCIMIPRITIYPISYHRIASLFILVILINPKRTLHSICDVHLTSKISLLGLAKTTLSPAEK
jgi:hypothetical protein